MTHLSDDIFGWFNPLNISRLEHVTVTMFKQTQQIHLRGVGTSISCCVLCACVLFLGEMEWIANTSQLSIWASWDKPSSGVVLNSDLHQIMTSLVSLGLGLGLGLKSGSQLVTSRRSVLREEEDAFYWILAQILNFSINIANILIINQYLTIHLL